MKYAFVYGGIAGAIVVSIITNGHVTGLPGHATGSELFGYLVMLAGLSLLFVGVKRYRDVECGGVIRFGRAFLVGLGIAVVAAIVYAAVWEVFLALSGRDFMAEYSAAILDGMRAEGASAAALAAKQEAMRGLAEMYRNPLLRIPMTMAEILPVGLIVALVSAGLLRNPRLLPARVGRAGQ